jgi:hypothetical protein
MPKRLEEQGDDKSKNQGKYQNTRKVRKPGGEDRLSLYN